MNIGESYERNLQGMMPHMTSPAPSQSPVPTNSSFPFQRPEPSTAEVTGIYILTLLMLAGGAFAICSALCRSTSDSPEPTPLSAREPGSLPRDAIGSVNSSTSVEMAQSPNQTTEAMTMQQKRDYITRLLLAKKFCTPNCDRQTSTLTDREMAADRDLPYDPETVQCTSEVCAICLEQFLSGDYVSESRNDMCKHRFHTACALEWLSKSQFCPCCRRNYLCQTAMDKETLVISLEVEQQVEAEGSSSNPGAQEETIGSDGWVALLVMLDLNG